jgi:hypothetical protein
MAAAAKRRERNIYRSYGNVAYAPEYPGSAVPAGEEVYQPRPSVRTRRRTIARPKVEVRPAGQVAPFAVLGFLAVAVFAALVVYAHVQLAVINDQTAALESQLSSLQTENSTLVAEYEQTFDMDSLQQAVGSYTSKPTADQYIYIDLSDEDTVEVFDQTDSTRGVAGALQGMEEIVGNIVEYFR